jgi:hypothetical protein
MIKSYVNKFIDNLPDSLKNRKKPLRLDLILDGGAFNGSYQIGCLYFLKEMERRKYIIIERISGTSIGSIIAFLYFIDYLELIQDLYTDFYHCFERNYNLNKLKDIKNVLKDKIPDNICSLINNKLFVNYYNIKSQKKIIKYTYKNEDDILNSLIQSSFIPFFIDGNLCYKKKYIDGFNPYIFPFEKNKKILYIDLFGLDKFSGVIQLKNEKTNFHRILSGLLDIHSFFIKQTTTSMCSYVNDWNLMNRYRHKLKQYFEYFCVYMIYFYTFIRQFIPNKYIPNNYSENIICKLLYRISKEIFIVLIETYCF